MKFAATLTAVAATACLSAAALAEGPSVPADEAPTSPIDCKATVFVAKEGDIAEQALAFASNNPFCFERCLNRCEDKDPTYGAVFKACVSSCRRQCPGPIA